MATKKHRPSPLEEPPSASSSSEDDRNSSSQKPEGEEDSSDDDTSSEEGPEEVHVYKKPPPPTPILNPKPLFSESDDGSETGSESESESDSDSKPKPQPTPPSKPIKVQTSPLPAKSGTKRAMENNNNNNSENDSKRLKKKGTADRVSDDEKEAARDSKKIDSENDAKKRSKKKSTTDRVSDDEKEAARDSKINTENDSKRLKKKATADHSSDNEKEVSRDSKKIDSENELLKKKATADRVSDNEKKAARDSKKISSQRLFSEEDELAILKGLADFITKTGKDPTKDTPAFYNFVIKSIQADANREQLRRKLRSLKNKYESNGNFTKPHDKKAFELFQKIGFSKEDIERTPKKGSASASVAEELVPEEMKEAEPVKYEKKKKESESVKDVVKSLAYTEMSRFGDELGLRSLLNMGAMKKGVELMGESKRAELAERWEKVQIAEMELLIARAELVREQTRSTLEAYKNSD